MQGLVCQPLTCDSFPLITEAGTPHIIDIIFSIMNKAINAEFFSQVFVMPAVLVWCVSKDNLFEWHFTIRGPADSEFDGGIYHGRIILPPEYPMKPPSIIILTVHLL